MEPIIIEISGKPVPWARTGGGRSTPRFTPEKVRVWKEAAGWLARQEMNGRKPLTGCISLEVHTFFIIPQGWPDWKKMAAENGQIEHTAKPDMDNIIKNVKDALNGIVWLDDAQVVHEFGRKVYSDRPRVSLRIEERHTIPSSVKSRKEFEKLKGKDS